MRKSSSIVLKVLTFFIVIIGLNYIYIFTFYEKDLQTHSPIINDIRNVCISKAEVIYLGESSNKMYSEKDVDRRRISEIIAAYYPSLKFGEICQDASHANMYFHFLNALPEKSSVKTVIVTMNLRSFDATWRYSGLETALLKGIIMIKKNPPLYNRFLLSFRGYEIKTAVEREKQFLKEWEEVKLVFPHPFPYKTVRQWDDATAINGVLNNDGTRNQYLTELACHYVKGYAFQINTKTNPRIKDFDDIVRLSKERNWNLVFNLLGENVETANKVVGKELVWLMRKNKELLVNRYQKKGVFVVDNLEKIPSSEYIDSNWTTEHYAQKGRGIIALNVAKSLSKFYPKKFIRENDSFMN